MDTGQGIREVQDKILEIIKYIDALCRAHGIRYYIMGGTALGAVRHGGFIPWDDDLDIFMTPDQYNRFKDVFLAQESDVFVLQEWSVTPGYLEYAKVRMNGTAFIEKNFMQRKDLHQGIYVDIMILHKVPNLRFIQKSVYYASKYVTLYALSQRNWKPKTKSAYFMLQALKLLPNKFLVKLCYKHIYRYDGLENDFKYCYWITKARFEQGLFPARFFSTGVDIPFEDTKLMGSDKIKEYLQYRYGDYMRLPAEEERKTAVHAAIFDTTRDFSIYLQKGE